MLFLEFSQGLSCRSQHNRTFTVEQYAILLQCLNSTFTLITRLRVVEDIYLLPDSKLTIQFEGKSEETLARALGMFKQNEWNALLEEVKKTSVSENNFRTLNDKALGKSGTWQTTMHRGARAKELRRAPYTCPYRDRKGRNGTRVPLTCELFTVHHQFKSWDQNERSGLLWVSADPCCGKSVLAKHLVDDFLQSSSTKTICYFSFKDDFADQRTQPQLLHDSILNKINTDGSRFTDSFHDLWDMLTDIAADEDVEEIVCTLGASDALDEFRDHDRSRFIHAVPYDHIRCGFYALGASVPTIHLSGEDEVEVEKITQKIDLVIRDRVKKTRLERTLDEQETSPDPTKGNIRRAIRSLPRTVNDAYEKILNRSPYFFKAKTLLHFVSLAIGIREEPRSYDDLTEELESEEHSKITLRDLCGLALVAIDRKVYLLHQTAKEFLVRNKSAAPLEGSSATNRWETLSPTIGQSIFKNLVCINSVF
ncbi:hypothetical protein BDV29DRAFT_188489 [Aspergillus leporis]|uniref:Nephrocystin 3-like N-terminal domain-containing protein n=1 Tax=Aspergillus leporis TaxID=41062 RepID=A0A5N5XAJ7_9EURO|nr:hypothetical protein BDV29DRAFT_188489 [Aspergillus leporis]